MRMLRFSIKFLVLLVTGLSIACAMLPRLDVTYKALPKSDALEGKDLYFEVTDKRPVRDIIGPGAKRVFQDFAGNITLIVETGPGQRSTVGLYDVRELFERAFTRYFENRGLKPTSDPKGKIPMLDVAIQDFTLDLIGSRWTARIIYEAAISADGRTAVWRYQGEGEKLRVSGLTQAHQVISETFSDIIHRLDVGKMLSALAEK
jgi:hypothetical protein